MTTEEKAKAYNEALERAREIKSKILSSHLSTESCKAVSEYIDTIIPELAESEDERIRKWIIGYAKGQIDGFSLVDDEECNKIAGQWRKAIAWLEKQKEQKHYWKPTETDVALFNKAVTTNKTLTPAERAQLDIIRSKFGCCRAVNCSGIVQKEQKPEDRFEEAREKYQVEWSEEEEKMLDAMIDLVSNSLYEPLCLREEMLAWLKSLRPQSKVELSEDAKKTLDEVSHILVGLNYKQIAKDYKQAVEKLLSTRN